jgi:hypothetical protein
MVWRGDNYTSRGWYLQVQYLLPLFLFLTHSTPIARTFTNNPSPFSLHSTRMGSKIRKEGISHPSDPPSMVDASLTMPSPTTRTTLRKSSRHAIFVVSGFHVCMRTVFVVDPRNLSDIVHIPEYEPGMGYYLVAILA